MNNLQNKFLNEKSIPLAKSGIWQLLQNQYKAQGVDIWNTIPFNISSNPVIANEYAYISCLYLQNLLHSKNFQFSEKVYLLELGAGTGQFGYYFLKQFNHYVKTLLPAGLEYCYIMTDLSKKTVAYWQKNPYFQKQILEKNLDFAVYDANGDDKLFLQNQQIYLNKVDIQNPMIIMGNYFLDSFPCDIVQQKNDNVLTCKFNIKNKVISFKENQLFNKFKAKINNEINNNLPETHFSEFTHTVFTKADSTESYATYSHDMHQVIERLLGFSEHGALMLFSDLAQKHSAQFKLSNYLCVNSGYLASRINFEHINQQIIEQKGEVFCLNNNQEFSTYAYVHKHSDEVSLALRQHANAPSKAIYSELFVLSDMLLKDYSKLDLHTIKNILKLYSFDAELLNHYILLIQHLYNHGDKQKRDEIEILLRECRKQCFISPDSEVNFISQAIAEQILGNPDKSLKLLEQVKQKHNKQKLSFIRTKFRALYKTNQQKELLKLLPQLIWAEIKFRYQLIKKSLLGLLDSAYKILAFIAVLAVLGTLL